MRSVFREIGEDVGVKWDFMGRYIYIYSFSGNELVCERSGLCLTRV